MIWSGASRRAKSFAELYLGSGLGLGLEGGWVRVRVGGPLEGQWRCGGGLVEGWWRASRVSVEGRWRACEGPVECRWSAGGAPVECRWRAGGGPVEDQWRTLRQTSTAFFSGWHRKKLTGTDLPH